MGGDAFLEMFAAAMTANMFIVASVAGFLLLFREDRAARSEGRKFRAPGYVYVLAIGPIVLGVFALYAISSSA